MHTFRLVVAGAESAGVRWHPQAESANSQLSQALALRQPECQPVPTERPRSWHHDRVDLDQLRALQTAQARELLTRLPTYDPASSLRLAEQLRAVYPADVVSAVLTQARLRDQARPRWGPIVDRLVLTPEGAEQATRPAVAEHRVRRFLRAGVQEVLDLGCGIGLDALAFANAGMRVKAIDRDAVTVAVASMNAAALDVDSLMSVERADVTSAQVSEYFTDADAVFADPARRADRRRLFRPEDWSPPLSWVLGLPVDSLAIKVAPGLDHDIVPAAFEFEVVSVSGDVVEGGLYRGALREGAVRRRATLLPDRQTVTDLDLPDRPPSIGALGQFLFEPDGAVIRSGLVAVVADQVTGRLLDPRIAYVTGDEDLTTPLATRYRVIDALPFSVKKLRSELRARGIGSITIKKRGFAAEPETIIKQLRLDRSQPGKAIIILTRIHQDPIAILVDRDH